MIKFGYKNKYSGLIRAAVAIAIGVVMVVSRTDAMVLAVRIMAAFLLASGIVSILVGIRDRQNNQLPLMGVNGIVDIFIALIVFMFPNFVAGLIVYIIGFVLFGFGIFQVISLISARKVVKVGAMAFVMPVAVVLVGVFLIARPTFIGTAVGTVAGAALIIYGVSELLSSWKMRKAIDVEYEKVDEQ